MKEIDERSAVARSEKNPFFHPKHMFECWFKKIMT